MAEKSGPTRKASDRAHSKGDQENLDNEIGEHGEEPAKAKMSNHNGKGNCNLRGCNKAHATKKWKS